MGQVHPLNERLGHRHEGIAVDLVEYLIVAIPDLESLDLMWPALAELTERSAIRILDLVVLAKDGDGAVTTLELDDLDTTTALPDFLADAGGMLSERDVGLASFALRPGTAGVVLVAEDRWAAPLSLAAQRAGGQIVAGERLPASRVQSALADRAGDDDREGW
jgi:hypothetical protein